MNGMRCLLCMVCCALSFDVFAQRELTAKQIDLRSKIHAYLRLEGFNPSVDKDGDIVFKSDEESVWLCIYDEKPFYIRMLHQGYTLTGENKYHYAPAVMACDDITKLKRAVKISCGEKGVIIAAEYFTPSIDAFEATFYKYLEALNIANKEFPGKYAEYKKQMEK